MKKNLRNLFLFAALSIGCQVSLAADPTASAPTPTADAAKVISVFSNAYTDLVGTNFNPNWGQSTAVSFVVLGTDSILKYSNLNYQGTEFTSTSVFAMTHLHIDVWTSDETSLQVTPVSPGAEKLVALAPLTLNAWNSFDIPLTSFTGVDLTKVYQFKFVGSGGKTVYLDNLYFVNKAAVDTEKPTAFTATKGTVTYNSVALVLNATDNSGVVAFDITYGTTTVSTSSLSGVSKTYTITGLESTTAYNFSVVAKDASGNTTSPIEVAATTLAGFAVPTVAAPTPTVAANKVISFYSDAYTNVSGTNFAASWGQPTILTTYMIGTNANMKYENFSYQGIELASHVDASAMTKLHLDVWTPNETNIRITPISPGKEFSVVLTPLNLNTWNSYDIDLTSFTGVVMSDLFQFKVDGGTGKIVYLDNLYLYNSNATAVADVTTQGLSVYPNPFADHVTVAAKSNISQVTVRNLLGQIVKNLKANSQEQTFDLSTVVAGNYLMTVKLTDGSMTTQKIIKN
ncbi:MAG: T9SS type A sorting domain-containing protein [Bacteroidales bacterium]|nr:T9SS type A sorting domain-containing protein [Bacteroidales bacterium]